MEYLPYVQLVPGRNGPARLSAKVLAIDASLLFFKYKPSNLLSYFQFPGYIKQVSGRILTLGCDLLTRYPQG